MIRKPPKSSVVPPQRDVRSATKARELFAVIEDPEAQRDILRARGTGVLVGEAEEVRDFNHAQHHRSFSRICQRFSSRMLQSAKSGIIPIMLKDILDRIDQRLTEVGLTESRASKLAGLSDSAIRDMRRAVRSGRERAGVSTRTLAALAPVLDTTADWLLTGSGDPSPSHTALSTSHDHMVPVRGTAAGSHERGSFQFTGDEIDYVPRPPALAGVRNLFALYVEGDSMEPEHRPGDLRFIAPDRPARSGDTVIVEARDDPGEPEWAMIGHLISRGEEIVIGKLNPKKEVRIPRLLVKRIHKVLSQNELFGR